MKKQRTQNPELARLFDEMSERLKSDDDSPDYIKEAKQIMGFLSDGEVGHTQLMTEAILESAVRAHVRLSPEVAAILYLQTSIAAWEFHNKNVDRSVSLLEVDTLLSIAYARLPILDELRRYERIKIHRRREALKKGGK